MQSLTDWWSYITGTASPLRTGGDHQDILVLRRWRLSRP